MPNAKGAAGFNPALRELDAAVQRLLAMAAAPIPPDARTLAACFAPVDAWVANSPLEGSPESLLPSLRRPGALSSLHRLRGLHESWLEQAQARELMASLATPDALNDYVQRHWPRTTIHSDAFRRQVRGRRACLLVGCGAVPSTAWLLMAHTALRVDGMDRSPDSCAWAKPLLSLPGRGVPTVLCEDAAERTDFSEWDVVFVAALAGVGERDQAGDRDDLVQHLLRHVAPGTLICLRSANGWGQLIYPKVSLDSLQGCDVETLPAPMLGRSDLVLVAPRRVASSSI